MDNIRPLLGTVPPEPAEVDSRGRPMKLYSFSFRHDRREWSFGLWAFSRRDAIRRLGSIRRGLKLDGLVVAIGDLPAGIDLALPGSAGP
jgi:hypothetical protein